MPKDQPRRNPNQRSYHLDDETVALLDAKAKATTLSQSAIVRMAIRTYCGSPVPFGVQPSPPEYVAPTAAAPQQETVTTGTPLPRQPVGVSDERNIVVPDPRQETFKVPERFVERGMAPGSHVDDDDEI